MFRIPIWLKMVMLDSKSVNFFVKFLPFAFLEGKLTLSKPYNRISIINKICNYKNYEQIRPIKIRYC